MPENRSNHSQSHSSTSNPLRDHWEKDVLPRLTPEMVYTHPSHRFQIGRDRWRGGSPFRESKSGTSFAVWPQNLRFYDSGLNFAGNPISYIHSLKIGRWEHPKGKAWVEALRELSRLAGVEHLFPERQHSGQEIKRAQKWEERRSIFSTVYHLCAEYLWSDSGRFARTHLIEERGFTEDQLRDLLVGLYPTLEAVQGTLREQGFNISLANECGVLTRKWEGYVVFPWLTPHGEPLTLYGHWPASKGNIPLKKNHPGWKKDHETAKKAWDNLKEGQKLEAPWFDPPIPKKYACWNPKDEDGYWLSTKQSPLYFDRVVKAGHKEAVLVEGVTDAAIAQAVGDTRVIACVAASLSLEQVQTLKRWSIERVNICLDPDSAGDKGIISCIRSLHAAGISPYVAPRLPQDANNDGDPDRFILEYGISTWKQHTSFDNATHGFRWMARRIIANHHTNGELSDAAREAILQEAFLFADSLDEQWSTALATYFWSEIKQTIGTIEIPEKLLPVANATVSLLQLKEAGENSESNGSNASVKEREKSQSRRDRNLEQNEWDAPIVRNGEIGKWYKDTDGFKFKPLTNFDFIVTAELKAPSESDIGGGYLIKVKRVFDTEEKEILLFCRECLTVKDFTSAINKKFGLHLSCRLNQDQLVALIDSRVKDYRINRSGKTYQCIDRWGQQEDGTWVFADSQFKADGNPTNQEESLWIYNPMLGVTDHIEPPKILPPNPASLRNLLDAQQKFAGDNFIYFLLCDGYVAASLHFQKIMKEEQFFPILNLCGDGGSKKTVAVRSALSLVGWGNSDKGGLTST
ncbi:MAG TPA: hypothetical protein DDW76_03855 [Cyanobacteria bacterium UBA11369]|nr:hypothetical protein [Cyanobacteria bacterium UBA11371]HBE35987.1 hypothetical protein [Cyanobacteria bacterium UBA11368]HBE47950.1 hypothetical protein [Cyanobacteria bacterium UBA11369]